MRKLEVCIDSVQSAIAAAAGGASRVELCSNLLEGGTTPSAGLIGLVRESISIGLHVLIRPRGGDFCYSALELEVMRREIQTAKQLGADGVVFGLLNTDGTIDMNNCKALLDLARPLKVTFHRAFDMAKEPEQALQDIITLGADYLLTSGQQLTASAGKELLARLVGQANGRIIIMPGAGVTEENIQQLAEFTNANEFHSSARRSHTSKMRFRRDGLHLGASAADEFKLSFVDETRVRQMVAALSPQ